MPLQVPLWANPTFYDSTNTKQIKNPLVIVFMSVLFFRLKSKELLIGVPSCFLEATSSY